MNQQKNIINGLIQILLPTSTTLGFLFTSLKNPQLGLVFNLIAQLFWLYAGWQAWKKANQIGIFITAIIITIILSYGVANYWLLGTH